MGDDRNNSMVTEVNERLRDELIATQNVLKNLEVEARGCRGGILNDRQHYDSVVNTLELLTIATLSATSSVSLLGRKGILGHMRARFDIGSGTQLSRHVNACVAYLRNDASALLAKNEFSQHEGAHVDQALSMLRQLVGMLLSGIATEATKDLRALRSLNAGVLLMAADELADYAEGVKFDAREASVSNPSPKGLPVPPRREDVEGTWNPAG